MDVKEHELWLLTLDYLGGIITPAEARSRLIAIGPSLLEFIKAKVLIDKWDDKRTPKSCAL